MIKYSIDFRSLLWVLGVMVVVLCFVTVSAQEQPAKVIKFGVYTADKPTDVYNKFHPILEHVSKKLSEQLDRQIKIELIIGKNYDVTVNQLVRGEIDFARLGPASYINAKNANPGIQIVAMELKKGKKIFYGIIFARKDSSINNLEDLKGKRFAFGNKESTIGRYLAQRALLLNGVNAEMLSAYGYLGRHDKVCTAVLAGDFDAGAAKEKTFIKYKERDVNLKEISRFPNVTKPWVSRSNIDSILLNSLRNYLIELDNKKILKHYGVTGFAEGSDEEYQIIRDAMGFGKNFESEK